MFRRRRLSTLLIAAAVAALTVALSGCGGSDGGTAAQEDTTEEITAPEDETTETAETSDETTTGDEADDDESDDLGTVPPPGEATVEIDGKTFTFLASDTLSERLLACDITSEAVTINFQTDGHDILVQARQVDSKWLGNITVAPMEVEGSYGSSLTGDEDIAVDGQSAVYTGNFTFTPQENPGDFQDVGEGRVAVTCP